MHAPCSVHACTFFNDNANDDDDWAPQCSPSGRQLTLSPTSSFSWRTKFAKKLRLAKIFKYQPHLIAGKVA